MTLRHLALLALLAPAFAGAQGFGGREAREGQAPNAWRQSPDVPKILIRAIREQRQGHYVGRRFVQFKVGRRTSQALTGPSNISHEEIIYRDGPRTRIQFPGKGPFAGQVIVETANERRYYVPDKRVIYILPPRREENYDRLVGIAKRVADHRVTITSEAGERIAGMSTEQLVVHDASGAIIQRLFIDPRSGVVMKRQAFDGKGEQIGYFQFSQINLSPVPFEASLFRLERPGIRLVTPSDTLRETAMKEGFDPIVLPATSGYRLEESRIAGILKEKVLVETYGSPKGRLTLFALHHPVSPDRLKAFARGDFQVFTWHRGNSWLVLVGPRTQDELGQIAQSVSSGTP